MSSTPNGLDALYRFQADYLGSGPEALKADLARHLLYTIVKDPHNATPQDWYNCLAYTVRDRLIERWMITAHRYYEQDVKRVYYLSMEFLLGRLMGNAMLNLGIHESMQQLLNELGLKLESCHELEPDAALGNGGLGRLAACFLDSMATLDLPGYGYGIRYDYGMFRQEIEHGEQVEHPQNWLRYGNPWEIPRPEVIYPIQFGGRVVEYRDVEGRLNYQWVDTEEVEAMAYDLLIPGYGTETVNNLRLWSAKSSRDFNLRYFNEGDYIRAVEEKSRSESISRVLYPEDTHSMGRELRFRQEYFFVSASVQDILRRYLATHDDLRRMPEKVAIQLNDTHPALTVPELMRLLIDYHQLDWGAAWEITQKCCAYTNHTLMPEALETWTVELFERLLPRHLAIIYEINSRFLTEVRHRFPGDNELARRLSLIGEEGGKYVRMAHVAAHGSHRINGVSELHTRLLKSTVMGDFDQLDPNRIINQTNGITPRRWLNQSNRPLARLLNEAIGADWVRDLNRLEEVAPLAEDAAFREQFLAAKRANRERLARYVEAKTGVRLDAESLFDVQIKRIHEYKRQLLNLLHIITRYLRLRDEPNLEMAPRSFIFAGKAAPGYQMAKLIIRLINSVAEVVNNDPIIAGRLRIAFVPDYGVSEASEIVAAADLSEQISTAGTEASGTGNMKLALNGALTIGTYDGANIEIRDRVGAENSFLFGLAASEIQELRTRGYNPWDHYHGNGELKRALDLIASDYFSPDDAARFCPIVDALTHGGDPFMLLADYPHYLDAQDLACINYRQPEQWSRMAILNVARMGHFSSDRTIRGYAEEIWGVEPVPQAEGESP